MPAVWSHVNDQDTSANLQLGGGDLRGQSLTQVLHDILPEFQNSNVNNYSNIQYNDCSNWTTL